ncbi:MAG TPA: outer membrane beta-barrel protein [Ignavibacteriaceae bacterium]|nr:outer membrane beta-barrel protein [Ignavibacteriaceae bacterium]
MKRVPGIIMILLLFTVNCLAQMQQRQPQMRLTLQAGLEVPTGDFSNQASSGFGGNATFEYWQNTPLAFTGSIGYNHFNAASDLPFGIDYSFTDVPILLGIRYYPSRGRFHPYLGAEMGLHILTSSITRTESRTITISETNSRFGIDPLIGFRYHLSQSTDLDFNVKYNIISTEGGSTNFLGINGGVQIGL